MQSMSEKNNTLTKCCIPLQSFLQCHESLIRTDVVYQHIEAHTDPHKPRKVSEKRGGVLKHLQWNLREWEAVKDMIWRFTLSVCLKILTPWLEVNLRSFPRPALSERGCSMSVVCPRRSDRHTPDFPPPNSPTVSLLGSAGCEQARPRLWYFCVSHCWVSSSARRDQPPQFSHRAAAVFTALTGTHQIFTF